MNYDKGKIEQLNEVELYRLITNREEQLYRVRLQEGFSIADENPKSPWISRTKNKFYRNWKFKLPILFKEIELITK